MVSHRERINFCSDLLYNSPTLMAENSWKKAFWILPRQGECVGMTDTTCNNPNKNFA